MLFDSLILMKNIQHLSKEEKNHFMKCNCGEYIDMRNLQEVFDHQHWQINPKVSWDYSIKKGETIAYTREGRSIKLN